MSTTLLKRTPRPATRRGAVVPPLPIEYPEGDGKPVAETPEHVDALFYAVAAARAALDGVPNTHIAGNNFVYYKQGSINKRVAPDCYIVLNVPRRDRRVYKTWEDNDIPPSVVWEFTSRGTAREDRETKFVLYEQVLKVPEYFMFDPLNQYLRPRLQGYLLTGGVYVPIVPDANGRLRSEQTGIEMFADGKLLRFVHPVTGENIPTYAEAEAGAKRANAETRRADDAETELARLRTLLAERGD